jgi:ribonuclease T2
MRWRKILSCPTAFRLFYTLPLMAALAAGLFAFSLQPQARQWRGNGGGEPGQFDYYALVLNWSPTYCEQDGRGDSSPQCSGVRPYAFVLHGLWPQYERHWPEFCHTRERPWVPQPLIDKMLDIMPSPRLVIHEYRKHGTCSGLDPKDFFGTARRAYDSIKIPPRFVRLSQPLTVSPEEVEKEFLAANPALQPDMIEVGCSRNRLRDVRICFTRDLKLRSCGENELRRKLCKQQQIVMPPVRYAPSGRNVL